MELDSIFGNGDGELSLDELHLQFLISLKTSCPCCTSDGAPNQYSDLARPKNTIGLFEFLFYTWDIYLYVFCTNIYDRCCCCFKLIDFDVIDRQLYETYKKCVGPSSTAVSKEPLADKEGDVESPAEDKSDTDSATQQDGEEKSLSAAFPRTIKALRLLRDLFLVASVGAIFFKCYGKEDKALDLTWVDAYCTCNSRVNCVQLLLKLTPCFAPHKPQTSPWSQRRVSGTAISLLHPKQGNSFRYFICWHRRWSLRASWVASSNCS